MIKLNTTGFLKIQRQQQYMKIVKTAGINWDKGHIYWKNCQKDFAIIARICQISWSYLVPLFLDFKERKKHENIIKKTSKLKNPPFKIIERKLVISNCNKRKPSLTTPKERQTVVALSLKKWDLSKKHLQNKL